MTQLQFSFFLALLPSALQHRLAKAKEAAGTARVPRLPVWSAKLLPRASEAGSRLMMALRTHQQRLHPSPFPALTFPLLPSASTQLNKKVSWWVFTSLLLKQSISIFSSEVMRKYFQASVPKIKITKHFSSSLPANTSALLAVVSGSCCP